MVFVSWNISAAWSTTFVTSAGFLMNVPQRNLASFVSSVGKRYPRKQQAFQMTLMPCNRLSLSWCARVVAQYAALYSICPWLECASFFCFDTVLRAVVLSLVLSCFAPSWPLVLHKGLAFLGVIATCYGAGTAPWRRPMHGSTGRRAGKEPFEGRWHQRDRKAGRIGPLAAAKRGHSGQANAAQTGLAGSESWQLTCTFSAGTLIRLRHQRRLRASIHPLPLRNGTYTFPSIPMAGYVCPAARGAVAGS